MSWELKRTQSMKCPCGKGQIIQETYDDDWGRDEERHPKIECTECQKKFKVFKKSHPQRKPYHGGGESYYLLPIDYPDYTGTQVSAIYKTKTDMTNISQRDFVEYLIVTYDLNQLIEAYNQMIQYSSYAKLTGTSKHIAKAYKGQFNSQRVKFIAEKTQEAIRGYGEYYGNYEQRKVVEESEKKEYAAYCIDREQYLIPITLNKEL